MSDHGIDPMLSDRFARALVAAHTLHRSQVRNGTTVPYVSHLLGTCAIALEFGADEDQAIAALLHDVLEDVRPTTTAHDAVAAFGDEVLRIVQGCSDADADPRPVWRPRKETYIARLAHEDAAILLVSASDKLHNARTIVADLHRHGAALFERFNPESDQLWYYRSLVTAFRANPAHEPSLIDALDRTVEEMERLAVEAGPSPEPPMTTWSLSVGLDPDGDLVWNGYDRGSHLKSIFGASEYEWWRRVQAAQLPALVEALGGQPGDDVVDLVRARFDSDVDFAAFAEAHGVETTFSSWGTTDWS